MKAGLPSGNPGRGEEIEGMMQQAPQRRQRLIRVCVFSWVYFSVGH